MTTYHKWRPDEVADVQAMVAAGKSTAAIAAKYQVSNSAIIGMLYSKAGRAGRARTRGYTGRPRDPLYSPDSKAALETAAATGKTIDEISTDFDCPPRKIKKYMRLHGIKWAGCRTRNRKNHRWTHDEVARLTFSIKSGKTTSEIAVEIGVTAGAINSKLNALKKLGAKIPAPIRKKRRRAKRPAKQHKWSRAEIDNVKMLRAAGQTHNEIATIYEVTPKSIAGIIAKNDDGKAPSRNKLRNAGRRWTVRWLERLNTMAAAGATRAQIAADLQRRPDEITAAAKKYNISWHL